MAKMSGFYNPLDIGPEDNLLCIIVRHVVQPAQIEGHLKPNAELGLISGSGFGRHQLTQSGRTQFHPDGGDVLWLKMMYLRQINKGIHCTVGTATGGILFNRKPGGADIVSVSQGLVPV